MDHETSFGVRRKKNIAVAKFSSRYREISFNVFYKSLLYEDEISLMIPEAAGTHKITGRMIFQRGYRYLEDQKRTAF